MEHRGARLGRNALVRPTSVRPIPWEIYKRYENIITRRNGVSSGRRASDGTRTGLPRTACESFMEAPSFASSMRPDGETVFLLPGPVKMDPRVLAAMATPAMNHRGPEFKEILLDLRGLVQRLFETRG